MNQDCLIPEDDVARMQQDAQQEPPSAVEEIQRAPESPTPAPVTMPSFHQLTLNVMFTFNLSNPCLFGQKDSLSAVDIEGEHVNMYSPLRKHKAKGNETVFCEGVLRLILPQLFDLTDALNSSRVIYAGSNTDIQSVLEETAEATKMRIANLMPLTEDTVVIKTQVNDNEDCYTDVTFGDIVRVANWLTTTESDNQLITQHQGVVNFIINSGALYDSATPAKYIESVASLLRMMHANRAKSGQPSTNILLGVTISPSFLSSTTVRQLIDELIEQHGFILHTRNELHRGGLGDWLPKSIESVDSNLLSPDADILLVSLCAPETAEE